MTALTPQLTKFDQRVLEAIPTDVGVRTKRIVDTVQGHHRRYAYDRTLPTRTDIIEVLRGLEHLGLIRQRNGWWRR